MKYNVMAVVWLMACLCTADITLGSDALNIEDIDEPSPSKRKKSTRKTPKDEVLKEIERGVYLKAGGGSFVAITGL